MPELSANVLRTRLAIVRHGMKEHGHRLTDAAVLDTLELIAELLARLEAAMRKAGP